MISTNTMKKLPISRGFPILIALILIFFSSVSFAAIQTIEADGSYQMGEKDSIASAKDAVSLGSTSRPWISSSTASLHPGTSVVITGLPIAAASNITLLMPSW